MNRFQTTALPYTAVCTDGDNYTIVARLDDGRLVAVFGEENRYAEVFSPEGSSFYGGYRLKPPVNPSRAAYLKLDPNVRDLVTLTFTSRRKIGGIKALRGLLGLALIEAKELWEELEAEYRTANPYAFAA